MSDKIGVGIVTCCNRESLFKCIDSIDVCNDVNAKVIVNDGVPGPFRSSGWVGINTGGSKGVGVAKNKAIKYLFDEGCDHIFLIEDDIYIKDPSVFQKYIEASRVTGIQHFNYSQHGLMNKTFDGTSSPNPRMILDYGGVKVPLYPHCVGAFSYYSRKCLDNVGFLDERYYNACEHVDHTLEIIEADMHPPFWYFADIENSWEYLGDEEWSLQQSTISSKGDHKEVVSAADKIFFEKWGRYPGGIPLTNEEELVKTLKEIKKTYGRN